MASFKVLGVQVQVSPLVVAGKDRGGEDLFIRVEASCEFDPPSLGWNAVDEGLRQATNTRDWLVYEAGDRVNFKTSHYGFEYSAPWIDFVDLVTRLLAEGDWHFSRKSGKWTLQSDHLVDGNAE